jgi:hypothetical protein
MHGKTIIVVDHYVISATSPYHPIACKLETTTVFWQ